MRNHNFIKLKTPKGEELLVNFNNVSHCTQTSNNHTSVKFNLAHGKDNVALFVVINNEIEHINELLIKNGLKQEKSRSQLR